MVAVKTADADRLLAKPDPGVRVILIYGADEGLVAERAERFVAAAIGIDPMGHVRLDGAALSADPGLLADEAHAVPLFGGSRVIWVRAAGARGVETALEPVIKSPPTDAWIVVTAGSLQKSSPLRKLCEANRSCWSIACYSDGARDLDRLIDEEAAASGMTISDDARAALKDLIGADRMVSRSEVRKVFLYATEAGEVTLDDVRAVVGDSGSFAIDETVDAVALGDAAAFDVGYRRLTTSGTPGFVVAGAALRHFNFLEKSRAAYDGGDAAESIVRRAVPPIFGQRQSLVARQIATWPAPRISRALGLLDAAMVDSRLHAALSDSAIGQTLQLVATLAARPSRG